MSPRLAVQLLSWVRRPGGVNRAKNRWQASRTQRSHCHATHPFVRLATSSSLLGLPPPIPTGIVIGGYADLPPELRSQAGETGEMSTDSKDGPITAQSWFVLDRLRSTIAAAGGTLDDVVKLTQYFCNLRDFPIYNEVRAKFFHDPPASTVVRVVELLPTPDVLLEVEAIAHIPEKRR
jgi:2-iminobutanoate/2-iminopropanoate deaminase